MTEQSVPEPAADGAAAPPAANAIVVGPEQEEPIRCEGLRALQRYLGEDNLLDFPKRPNGSPQLLRQSFFERLFKREMDLNDFPMADVSAAQTDIRYLSLAQLLRIRCDNLDFSGTVPSLAAQAAFLEMVQNEIETKISVRLAVDGRVLDAKQAFEFSHMVFLIYAVHGRCEADKAAESKCDFWLLRSSGVAGVLCITRCAISSFADMDEKTTYCHTTRVRPNLRVDKSKRLLHWEVVLSEKPSEFKDAGLKKDSRPAYVPGARRSRASLLAADSPATDAGTPQDGKRRSRVEMCGVVTPEQAEVRKAEGAVYAAATPPPKVSSDDTLQLRRELATSRAEYTALYKEFEKVNAASLSSKTQSAEAEVAVIREKEAKSAEDAALAASHATAITAVRDELATATSQLKQNEAELTKVKEELAAATSHSKQIEAEPAKVKDEAEAELARVKIEAEAELARAKADAECSADAMRDEAARNTQKIEEEHKRAIEAAGAEAEDLRQEISALKADAEKASAGDEQGLQNQLAAVREELVAFESKARDLEALQQDHASLKETHAKELESLQNEHASLKERADVSEREADSLRKCETALVASEVRARAMSEELSGANDDLAELSEVSEELDAAKKELQDLRDELAAAKARPVDLEELVGVLREQLESANGRAADVEELVVVARQEADTVRIELTAARVAQQVADATLRKCTCGVAEKANRSPTKRPFHDAADNDDALSFASAESDDDFK